MSGEKADMGSLPGIGINTVEPERGKGHCLFIKLCQVQ